MTVSISIKGRASAFGVLMLLSLLSACAMFEAATNQNYYTWDGPPSVPIRQYEWQTGSAEEVQQRCSFKYEIAAGCTIRLYGHPNGPTCIIISTVTESEAHRHHTLSPTGTPMESHWHHEVVEHCFNGKNHRSS